MVGDEVVGAYEMGAAEDDGITGDEKAENADPGDLSLVGSVGVWSWSDGDDAVTAGSTSGRT